MDRLLQTHLDPIARGARRWQLWRNLAICWAVAAAAGLATLFTVESLDWSPAWIFFLLLVGAVVAAAVIVRRFGAASPDYQAVARRIEEHNPELHALLLTAVEQKPDSTTGQLNYLQQRVIEEALEHHRRSPWGERISRQLFLAQGAHWAALLLFLLVLAGLRPSFSHGSGLWAGAERSNGVSVTPGDTNVERGTGLVVLARFNDKLPADAELVIKPVNEAEQHIPLAKNLGDPVFGGGVPEVKGDLTYRIEFTHGRTRDFKVTAFDYPRLDHADARLTYPEYTHLPEKTVKDTRRVSAVEGTALNYSFFLNKSVTKATLVAKDKSSVPLTPDSTNATIYHSSFTLDESRRYELVLVDDAGRTNRVPPEFVLEALKSQPPELKIASPRGDQRVSPLEEISFEGEASDEFGLSSYGIAYTPANGETKTIELGKNAGPREKRQFNFLLAMENLKAQPDQLVSYYLWADDTGPDGRPRRTTSDIYFAEIRPFDEIFREGQPQDPNQNNNNSQGGQGNQSEQLAELQKQIISATWNLKRRETGAKPSAKYKDDTQVVRDSQQQALDQVRSSPAAGDERLKPFVEAAEKSMEKASGHLGEASDKNSVAPLPSALTDEQSAYQALLKLSAREYQVTQGARQSGRGRSGGQRSQRQIDQLDLKQTANRYETQREASPTQTPQQREQLQVANRLKELAQRQQDLNQRLRELQTALQEAKTEQEREQLRQQLKRLRDEQQDMLADVDELRQRMERPENQSSMSQERQQLDQTRSQIQSAGEALKQQAVSQALASGTRAQRELQQLQDDFRKKNSNQFAEDMRQMRDDAQKLAQNEENLGKKIDELADPGQKNLSESDEQRAQRSDLASQLSQQKNSLTNLFNQMRDVSEQSETAEPLLSSQLYDLLRQTSHEDLDKALDSSSELVRRGFAPQAAPFEQTARQHIDELNRGVQRAAESVLGDPTEALRLAKRELEDLSRQLNQESAEATNELDTNSVANAATATGAAGNDSDVMKRLEQRRQQQLAGGTNDSGTNAPGNTPGGSEPRTASSQQPGDRQPGGNAQNQPGQSASQQPGSGNNQNGRQPGEQPGQSQEQASNGAGQNGGDNPGQGGGRANQGPGQRNGSQSGAIQNLLAPNNGGGAGGGWSNGSPLTGENYTDWSDRLRDVEEMVDVPDLRTEVAGIRDRARAVRLDYKRTGKKPDWDVIKTQISAPLAEVRARVDEELLRRESKDALVPLDRDPVPAKFSDLVRRYYEQLGKDN